MLLGLHLDIQQDGFSAQWHRSNFHKCILLAHQVAAVLGTDPTVQEIRAVMLHPCDLWKSAVLLLLQLQLDRCAYLHIRVLIRVTDI